MGNYIAQSLGKMGEGPGDINRDYFEVVGVNGFVFQESFIPGEILTLILCYVDPDDLVFNCRRVCKVWCNIIDREVLRFKCGEKYNLEKLNELPWFVFYWLSKKQFLNRNLIKNGCGQENLAHWKILSNGGDQWAVERPPHGVPDFPKESMSEEIINHNSTFVTSYYSCSKHQIIDLKAEGVIPYFIEKVYPCINVSEWFCGRFDCSSVYELKVRLLDENQYTLEEFEFDKHVGGNNACVWEKAWYVFKDYSPDVRYIEFYHAGQDGQFWKGHFGSRMTGASVYLSLP